MHCKTTEPKTSVQLKREDGGSALPFQSLEPHWILRSMLCQEALGDLPPVAKKKEKERKKEYIIQYIRASWAHTKLVSIEYLSSWTSSALASTSQFSAATVGYRPDPHYGFLKLPLKDSMTISMTSMTIIRSTLKKHRLPSSCLSAGQVNFPWLGTHGLTGWYRILNSPRGTTNRVLTLCCMRSSIKSNLFWLSTTFFRGPICQQSVTFQFQNFSIWYWMRYRIRLQKVWDQKITFLKYMKKHCQRRNGPRLLSLKLE